MDATLLCVRRFKPCSQKEVKLAAIDIEFNSLSALTPSQFSRTLPLSIQTYDQTNMFDLFNRFKFILPDSVLICVEFRKELLMRFNTVLPS